MHWINEQLTPCDIWQHGVVQQLAHRVTPFQEMDVVESGPYGKGLVLDGKWQTCTGDEFLYHEPIVHAPCVLHGSPERVLIAGGADGGALREVLKWKTVKEAVVADIDGDVVQACRELLPEIHQGAYDDPRAKIQIGDAWDLIANTPNHWDVIIADLTDPIEEGPAYKLFTQEFFTLCKHALRPGGVFVNQAGSQSPPLVDILIRVLKTISTVFEHTSLITANVPTYGSPWGLALAADRKLDLRPEVEAVNALLRERLGAAGGFPRLPNPLPRGGGEGTGSTAGGGTELRMFDGEALLGMLQSPKYIRERLVAETTVYTVAAPPKFLGRGQAGAAGG